MQRYAKIFIKQKKRRVCKKQARNRKENGVSGLRLASAGAEKGGENALSG